MITRRRILTKKINKEAEDAFVDLGLPSGLLWATGNIVKDTQGNYSIGNETDYGCHFSWGNIVGHNVGDGYDFGRANNGPYANTPGVQVSANIASNDASHDAALARLGAPWHLPTKENFQELYDNTDNEWVIIDNVSGWKFMKKNAPSVYVFFPAAGTCIGTDTINIGKNGYYWSSSWDYNYNANAYFMSFNSSSVYPQSSDSRFFGFSVRAIRSSNSEENIIGRDFIGGYEYVDLGLPSGLLWATDNVGAETETDYGDYYMYGKGATKYIEDRSNIYTGTEKPLSLSVDTARQVMGEPWRMPTGAECTELIRNTTYSWETIEGIFGAKFTAANGSYVFFPASGVYNGYDISELNINGYYLSSTPSGNNQAFRFVLRDDYSGVNTTNRDVGYTIRGVCKI